ncbi:hypothetical protein AAD018_000760 [Aestuariibius insulae]|uniref:hypothetical protein n=1 Tax=Aestuariibius insulae TaxID=2058287 RepID=UPI00345E420D
MIAFFGHNVNDAAVARRAAAFQKAGHEVIGYMPRRGPAKPVPWANVDLGETFDGAYWQRIKNVRSGFHITREYKEDLERATILYARNLDMLALTVTLRRNLRLKAPIVYECLDVHHRLTGDALTARMLRRAERAFLKQTSLVVISSPRFATEHFRKYYPKVCRTFLIENRLIDVPDLPPRPSPPEHASTGPLRIGWFGNLRCRRSLDLLLDLARTYPTDIEVTLRGYPARTVIPDLEGEIEGIPNITFHGRYEAPKDLEAIYSEVDLVWAGDWYEDEANSVWLLPNRIYEGGYFATPALAPAGTETARWIAENGAGLLLDSPVETSLPAAISRLIADRSDISTMQKKLLNAPRSLFVEEPELIDRMIETALGSQSSSDRHSIAATGPGAETGR